MVEQEAGRRPLELHIPEPAARPGEDVNFSHIDFTEGAIEKSKGWTVEPGTTVGGQTYEINALAQAAPETERRIYSGLGGAAYSALRVWDSGVGRDLGHAYANGQWSLETWGTWLLATNDVDPVQVWKGGVSGAAALAGVAVSRAKIVRKLANHVILYNTNLSGQEARWCSRSDPETWTATEATTAGDFTIRDLDGDIECVEPLGDALAFYTQDSMGLTQYVGAPFIFSHTVRINGIGAVSSRAVAAVGKQHYGLSRKGFWRTDGFSLAYVDSPAVKRWFQSMVDWTLASKICVFHNEQLERVEWYFTDLSGNRLGIAYDYARNNWTKLKKPITAVIEQQVYNTPIAATGTGFGFFPSGVNANGAALTANLSTTALDGGQKERFKRWDMLRVEYTERVGTVEVRFGFSDTSPEESSMDWSAWSSLARENWINRESIYLMVQFRWTGLDSKIRIGGLDILGEGAGYQ